MSAPTGIDDASMYLFDCLIGCEIKHDSLGEFYEFDIPYYSYTRKSRLPTHIVHTYICFHPFSFLVSFKSMSFCLLDVGA